MRVMKLVVASRKLDAVGFCESVSEIVGCTALKSLAVVHHGFYRICRYSSRKSLLFRLLTLDRGYSKVFPEEIRVYVQHLYRALFCFLRSLMHGMTLLP